MGSLVDLRPGEGVPTLASGALFFLVVASHYLIKPVRNSLFIEHVGADNLPYVYIATAVVIGLLISSYSRHVVDRLSPRRLIPTTYGFLALSLAGFSWMLREESLATSAIFYIWAKLYPVLTVSQFWLMTNAMFEPRQARRLFGFIGAGGILGGIAGGVLAGTAAETIGTENVLLAAAVVIAVCAALATHLHPDTAPTPRKGSAAGASHREPAPSAARLVRESAHLRALSTILMLAIVVSTVVDWQMNKAVELFVAGEDARTAFFGRFYGVLNAASFLIQIGLTGYILKRFGVGLALLLLPLGLLTGAIGVLVHPALWTAVLAKGADGTLRYSLDQSTRELLFLPVPHAVKARAKPFIDVAAQRGGTGIAGVLILVATQVASVPFQYLSLVSVAAIAAWVAAIVVVRREYIESVKRLVHARDVEVDELVLGSLDADHRRQLLAALEGDDPDRVLYALKLLELTGEVDPHDRHFATLLRHPNPNVRERAAAALVTHGDQVLLDAIQPLLEDDDLRARSEAVRLLCRHCVGDELMHFQMLLADPRARVRAGAIAGFYNNPDRRLRDLAEKGLHRLASEVGPDGAMFRRQAALLTTILPASETTRHVLLGLIEDADEAVRQAAILAAARSTDREVVPALIRALGAVSTREGARAALVAFGDRILGTLSDHLRDPSFDVLLDALEEPDLDVRYHILKALNRLRRDHPELSFRGDAVERALRRELALLTEVHTVGAALRSAPRGEGSTLLALVLAEREDDGVERITRCLGLLYPLDEIFHAYRAMTRGRGIELLDTVLRPAHRLAVVPLLERLGRVASDPAQGSPSDPAQGRPVGTISEASERLRRADPWLAACLAFVELKGSREHRAPSNEERMMMTIVERVDFLRTIEMFSGVRTEYLAKIAAVAKERMLAAGEALFEQGTLPEALSFVLEGEIRATKDGEEAWVARRGEVMGVIPVLDRKPAPVSARAVGTAGVLSVDAEVFDNLMLDNPALPLGIVRYLAGEVRRLLAEPRGEAAGAPGRRA
ncbi:MAG: MFS transporter [Acidobacteria bacterium]|nr:MFS transporter [Acidobacteriota bacterium]